MADEQKFDRFRPTPPNVPGVPVSGAAAPTEQPAARARTQRLVVAGAGLGVIVAGLLWYGLRPENSVPIGGVRVAEPAAGAPGGVAAAPASAGGHTGSIPVAPGEIGKVEEFAKPWSAKRFLFRRLSEESAAMIIRLPSGSARSPQGYWAFGLGRGNEACQLQLVQDREVLARDFDHPARHPMVVDPCTRAVFDPLRLGEVGGAWIRGDVVRGPAYRPPPAILIRVDGSRISAVRME